MLIIIIIYAKIIELYLSKVICLKYNNHLNQPHIIFHQQSIKYHKLSKIQKQLHQENNILYSLFNFGKSL